MDAELVNSIKGYAANEPRIRLISSAETERLRGLIASRFGFPENQIWWWESLPATAQTRAYESNQGLERLSELLPGNDASLYLFATDDDPPPWLCVCGQTKILIDMLREQRFFEYFIVDPELKWIVFDTHHNSLIWYGDEPLRQ